MGDCGSNLLGLLLGAVVVEGTLKTNALIALVGPLVILAVPFLDTSFVVAKRIKYRPRRLPRRLQPLPPPHAPDRLQPAPDRPLPVRVDDHASPASPWRCASSRTRTTPATSNAGWSVVMGALLLVALAASVYLVYVLEILKLRRLRAWQLRRTDPDTSEHEIDARRRAGARDRRVHRAV